MIKKMLKKNFKIKLLSFLFAFFMWIFVMAEVDPIVSRTIDNVPVSIITNQTEVDESGLVVSPQSNILTQVSVRGRRSLVNSYSAKGPVVTGTIKKPRLGINKIDLAVQAKDNVGLSLTPLKTDILLEKVVSAKKIITTRIIGELSKGYEINKIEISPNATSIEGPESMVSQVSEVIATIDVSNVKSDFVRNVRLMAIDAKGNEVEDIRLQVRFVEANVDVHKKKMVPLEINIADRDGKPKLNNYYIEPREIEISGEEHILKNITSIKSQPLILEQLKQAGSLRVKLAFPEGISSNIDTGKLEVNSENVNTINLEYNSEDIFLEGYDEAERSNIKAILPEKIKVSLAYDKAFEGELIKDDIKVYIDRGRSDAKLGRYYFGVQSKMPYTSFSITPNVINKIN